MQAVSSFFELLKGRHWYVFFLWCHLLHQRSIYVNLLRATNKPPRSPAIAARFGEGAHSVKAPNSTCIAYTSPRHITHLRVPSGKCPCITYALPRNIYIWAFRLGNEPTLSMPHEGIYASELWRPVDPMREQRLLSSGSLIKLLPQIWCAVNQIFTFMLQE